MAPLSHQRTALADDLDSLGLEFADLVQGFKTIVVVEGEHDKIVLEQLVADQLDVHRCLVLPARGTHGLQGSLGGGVLFRMTTAQFVIVLDNARTERLNSLIREVERALRSGGIAEARDTLGRLKKTTKSGEERDLRRALSDPIDEAVFDLIDEGLVGDSFARVRAFGLGHKDVIEYLPVGAFVSANRTWEQLRKEHSDYRSDTSGTADFKRWLANAYRNGDPITLETIRSGVAMTDASQLHEDFKGLVSALIHPLHLGPIEIDE